MAPWLVGVTRTDITPDGSVTLEGYHRHDTVRGVLGGIPAEPFAEMGLAAAERYPERPAFVTGCSNGWIGYLPSSAGYPLGGHEVEWAPVVYGVESGWLTPATPDTAGAAIDAAIELTGDLLSGP